MASRFSKEIDHFDNGLVIDDEVVYLIFQQLKNPFSVVGQDHPRHHKDVQGIMKFLFIAELDRRFTITQRVAIQ